MLEMALRDFLVSACPRYGENIYPDMMPDPPVYPALVYHRVSRVREVTHDGANPLIWGRWQLDTWARTREEAERCAITVSRALVGFNGQMSGIRVWCTSQPTDIALVDPDTGSYRTLQQYVIWHDDDDPPPEPETPGDGDGDGDATPPSDGDGDSDGTPPDDGDGDG